MHALYGWTGSLARSVKVLNEPSRGLCERLLHGRELHVGQIAAQFQVRCGLLELAVRLRRVVLVFTFNSCLTEGLKTIMLNNLELLSILTSSGILFIFNTSRIVS